MDPHELSVLFIGNSYTYYNEMPEKIFKKLLEAAGFDAAVVSATKGGWYLIDSAKPDDELGAQIEAELKSRRFDYVVLQEQSVCPALGSAKFYTGVRGLFEKIKANGASAVLYSTWGRKEGHRLLTEYGLTNESMTWMVAAAYEAIGAELDLGVAHVGLAFLDVNKNHGDIELYHTDGTHPSAMGSYLAALTILGAITGIDPTAVGYDHGLCAEHAGILKEAARKAVFEAPNIPDKYKTESNGIEYRG